MFIFRSIAAIRRAVAAVRGRFAVSARAPDFVPLSARAAKPQTMDRKNKRKSLTAGSQTQPYLKGDTQEGQSRAYLR